MDEKARESNRLRQRKFLELHKEEVNEKRRERYQERVAVGKCPRCGGRVRKGRKLCTTCSEYMLDLNRKYAEQKKDSVEKAMPKTAKPAAKTAKTPVKTAKTAAKTVKTPAKTAKTAKTVKTPAKTAKTAKTVKTVKRKTSKG